MRVGKVHFGEMTGKLIPLELPGFNMLPGFPLGEVEVFHYNPDLEGKRSHQSDMENIGQILGQANAAPADDDAVAGLGEIAYRLPDIEEYVERFGMLPAHKGRNHGLKSGVDVGDIFKF